jgi:hypothetical protein
MFFFFFWGGGGEGREAREVEEAEEEEILGIESSSPGSRIVLCTDGQANVGFFFVMFFFGR